MEILDVPIDEVVLQPDNAIIRRKCRLELVQGRNIIDIGNLDPDLDSTSLQFIISGKSVVIHNMRFSIQTVDNQQKIRAQQSLKSKNLKEIRELESMIEDIDFLLDLYDGLREDFAESFATAYAKTLVTIGDYLDFYNLLEIEFNQHAQKKEELQLQIQELKDKTATIVKSISALSTEEQQQKKGHLTLIIESEAAQAVDVQLEYLLQAGFYKMNLSKHCIYSL